MHLFWGTWLRTLCHWWKKKGIKPRCQVDSNSRPLDYEAGALTTSAPSLPGKKILDLFTYVTPAETTSYAESSVDTDEDWRDALFISLRLLCFILLEKGIRCQWHGWERERMSTMATVCVCVRVDVWVCVCGWVREICRVCVRGRVCERGTADERVRVCVREWEMKWEIENQWRGHESNFVGVTQRPTLTILRKFIKTFLFMFWQKLQWPQNGVSFFP